jgi:hypothetical protein
LEAPRVGLCEYAYIQTAHAAVSCSSAALTISLHFFQD